MKQLLIVGIDPGTTVGYAALDISGKLIKAHASKELNLDALIAELCSLGTTLIIATDKAKVPAFVAAAATQLGARVFTPAEDLQVAEKRELTSALACKGNHEMDALAAAVVAFKRHERLLSRIDRFLAERKRPELGDALKELVIRQGISITAGFELLTVPEKARVRIMRERVMQRTLKEEDYWRLYNELVIAEQDKAVLQRQNRKLENALNRLRKKLAAARAATRPETRIIRPTAELEQARRVIADLQRKLEHTLTRQQRLQHVLLNRDAYVVAKRMRNLGFDEFRRVSRVLGVRKQDILFIEDPNSFSERTLDELAGVVELVIAVQQPKPKVAERLPFVILDAASIPHTQDDYFAFLDRKALEQARSDKALLRKLIREYQAARQGNRDGV